MGALVNLVDRTQGFDGAAARYTGETASNYDSDRRGRKWDAEVKALRALLQHVDEGAKTLDAPVGTGRFFQYFNNRRLEVHGYDISNDMLARAKAEADRVGGKLQLKQGNLESMPYPDGAFDLVVCIRFLNLVERHHVEAVMRELSRVSSGRLLIAIRYIVPLREFRLRGLDLMRLAMRPIWIARRLVRKSAVLIQPKKFVTELLRSNGLTVLDMRYAERSPNGTDYVFMLLQKRNTSPTA